MPARIVVTFRGHIGDAPGAAAAYLGRALATKKRAEAHGATLIAWSAVTFSFDLAADELEEALALAATVHDPSPQGEPTPLMVGVAEGRLEPVGEEGPFASLSWGRPLVVAAALSREAAQGEVLVDAAMAKAREDEIVGLGWAVQLDVYRGAHKLLAKAAPAPRAPAPTSPVTVPVAPEARPSQTPISIEAHRALVDRDGAALERLVATLRDAGAPSADRIAGVAALRRGATGEALRSLRAATEADQEPGRRARAHLAHALALASAGRAEAALLEGLRALARAREAADGVGEVACARFLEKLSDATGNAEAAATWRVGV